MFKQSKTTAVTSLIRLINTLNEVRCVKIKDVNLISCLISSALIFTKYLLIINLFNLSLILILIIFNVCSIFLKFFLSSFYLKRVYSLIYLKFIKRRL